MLSRICLTGVLLALAACSPMATVPTQTPPGATGQPTGVLPGVPAASASTAPMPTAANQSTMPTAVPAGPPAAPAKATPRTALARPSHPGRATPKPAGEPARPTAAKLVDISGSIELQAAPGQRIEPGEQVDTLVYFVPQEPVAAPKPGRFTVYTHNRDFSPGALAVPLGSTVTFTNLDEVRHNVFSVTPGSAFDLGFQADGESASHVFTHAGAVLISCNVHRSMEVDLWVIPSPYVGRVAADGSFRVHGVPAGPGTLQIWNPRARPVSMPARAPASGLRERLLLINPRVKTELHLGGQA